MCFLDLFVECGINGGFCVMYLSMVKSHILSMFFFFLRLDVILGNGYRIWKTKLSFKASGKLNGPRVGLGLYCWIYNVRGTHIEA